MGSITFTGDPRSGIFSAAAALGTGPGGNISINAGQLHITNGGIISAQSSATEAVLGEGIKPGNAGNINVIVGDTLHMDNGTITVATLGDGNAGNVLLNVA